MEGEPPVAIAPNSPDAMNQALDAARAKGILVLAVNGDLVGNESHRDANILPVSVEANDFPAFLAVHPAVQLICFNGSHAEKLFHQKVALPFPAFRRLPSTSPAHASMRPEQKLAVWRDALTN